jgi:hypothetical protein
MLKLCLRSDNRDEKASWLPDKLLTLKCKTENDLDLEVS